MNGVGLFLPAAATAVTLLASACVVPGIDNSAEAAAKVRQQDLGDLPYHPLVFHLDLAIYTYQLYTQSLVWPFDPYYEEMTNISGGRRALMDIVDNWAIATGNAQTAADVGFEGYRGPGRLSGFDDNPAHDPIIYQYNRIHPWSTAISNAEGRWAEYLTPTHITRRIKDAYVCYRTTGKPEGTVTLDALPARPKDAEPGASDVLMAFEGGTGDRGEPGQPASHSLMGLVLVRQGAAPEDYDVHIAFRGSRSGSGLRALLQAVPSQRAQGNPDWVSDLGTRLVGASFISTTGRVSRGMSRSVQTTFPQLFGCLDELVGRVRNGPPRNIYVTGHSLGGGLAQHFVSSVLLGDWYGPSGALMPSSLSGWPWANVKLITFGAPQVGNRTWAETLTTQHLDARFFDSPLPKPYDDQAIAMTNLDIIPDLLNPNSPAAYRVLLPKDPITTRLVPGSNHVGSSVYLDQPEPFDAAAPPDVSAHEPLNERNQMVDVFRDDRIPRTAWAYRDMSNLNPDRNEDQAGTPGEYVKLWTATKNYYADRDIWFDQPSLDRDFAIFTELLHKL